jgi:hypothetical protein
MLYRCNEPMDRYHGAMTPYNELTNRYNGAVDSCNSLMDR